MQTKLKYYLWITLLASFTWLQAETADAGLMFGATGGYGMGTLTRKSAETISGIPAQGQLGYQYKQIGFLGFFQHTALEYTVDSTDYTGAYSMYGAGLKLTTKNSNLGRYSLIVQQAVSGSYTVVSESKIKVQDYDYLYSTLTTLKGASATQVLFGYEFMSVGRRTQKRGGSTYLGVYLSMLSQKFSSQTTRVKTNNSVLAPVSPGTEAVDYSVSLTGILLAFTFETKG